MRFKNLWLVFDKTFSNGKMSYVTIVYIAEMIKLSIQSFFIWGHLVSHLSKFDQVKFGQMKKQHFDSIIMNSKWLQIEKFWVPSLLKSLRSTIVVLVNFPFWDSLDGSNLWFLNFDIYKLVFGTLDCLKLKSFEYQVCSAHQDLHSLYRPFFHLRKFEQNVVQIFTSVWHSFRKSIWDSRICD